VAGAAQALFDFLERVEQDVGCGHFVGEILAPVAVRYHVAHVRFEDVMECCLFFDYVLQGSLLSWISFSSVPRRGFW